MLVPKLTFMYRSGLYRYFVCTESVCTEIVLYRKRPTPVWSHTRRTEGVVHSLNDAVFKLFLTGLLNDSQCDVGGCSGARGKVQSSSFIFQIALINRCITADHLVIVVVHVEWGASVNLDVCCRCMLTLVPPDITVLSRRIYILL